MAYLRWSRWRTLTKVLTIFWVAMVVSTLLLHNWLALFYYTLFLGFQVITAAQEALISEQRETINGLRRQNNSLKRWWQ